MMPLSALMSLRSHVSRSTTIPSAYAGSIDPLPSDLRNGMIAMGAVGLFSFISTISLLSFITIRMISWKKFYDKPIHQSQIFILIYNLVLADFQQALSFVIALNWSSQNKLVGPSTMCFAQGWLIQIGDVSSGLWVLAIAAHTAISLIGHKAIPKGYFISGVLFIWSFCLLLTAIGPLMHRKDFFVPAGAWCWINEAYENERLYLHYLWIFLAQGGSVVIYLIVFLTLRRRLEQFHHSYTPEAQRSRTSQPFPFKSTTVTTVMTGDNYERDPFESSRQRVTRAARYMVVYPVIYVVLTMPLAAGRVSAMVGRNPSLVYYCVAGALMSSCGVIDVILYISTRKALVKSSVGVKGSQPGELSEMNRSNPRSERGQCINVVQQVRMDIFSEKEEENGGRGGIVVSKSVVSIAEDRDSRSQERIEFERPVSQKGLVGGNQEIKSSWLL